MRFALALLCASCSWAVHEDAVPDTLAVDLTGPWVDESQQIVVLMVQDRASGRLSGVAVRPGDDAALGFVSGDVGLDGRGQYAVHLTSLGARVSPNATASGQPCVVGDDQCCFGLHNCFCEGRAGAIGVCRASGVSFTMSGTVKLSRPSGDPILDLQGTLSLQTAQSSPPDVDVEVFLRRAPEWYRRYFGTDGSPPQDLSLNPDLDCLGGADSTIDDAPESPDVEAPGPDSLPDGCLEFLEATHLVSGNARTFLTRYRCGDGRAQTAAPFSEECDDGNADDDDDCVGVCRQAECGDGLADLKGTQFREECDLGTANNRDDTDCLAGCKLNVCGDGKLNRTKVPGTDSYKEECDERQEDDSGDCVHCHFAKCGDGVTHMHRSAPPLPSAGPLEQCDDANASDEDHCLTSCTLNVCGDGHVDRSINSGTQLPYEQCDLGAANDQNGDCVPGCQAARCGDMFLHTNGTPPFEVCEPPSEPSSPGCNQSCTLVDTEDFQVNTTYTLSQEEPAVAAWPDGSFVVVFQTADTQQPAYNFDIGIRARIFNEDGGPHTSSTNPLGMDFIVNTRLVGRHTEPVVTARMVGGQKSFVVAWMKLESGNFDTEARIFDGHGNALPIPGFDCEGQPIVPGHEFCVPYTVAGDARHAQRDQAHPSIASDAMGNFIIVYEDDAGAGPDTLQRGIRARLYGPDAQPIATPLGNANTDCNPPSGMGPAPACCGSRTCDFQINTTFAPTKYLVNLGQCNLTPRNCYQVSPRVGMGNDGTFLVAYVDFSQEPQTSATWPPETDPTGGNTEIRARLFAPGGAPAATPLGNTTLACDPRNANRPACCAASTCDFVVNTIIAGDQDGPVVNVAADNSFLIAWADQSVTMPPDPNVRYRAFLAGGAARDRNDRMLPSTFMGAQKAPAGARGPSGFFFAWADSSAQTLANPSDIRGIRLDTAGMTIGSDFGINVTTPLQTQSQPAVAVAANGTIIVVFDDASYANPNCTTTPSTPDCIDTGVRAHIFYRGRTP